MPDRTEGFGTVLQQLILIESQEHQLSKVIAQVLVAVSIIVFEVIALILQGIEGFIFDFPTGSCCLHQEQDIRPSNGNGADPGKMLMFSLANLFAMQKIDARAVAAKKVDLIDPA